MKKVVVFLAHGFEELEAITAVNLLRRGGIQVDLISISSQRLLTGRTAITLLADGTLENRTFSDYDGIILPGGMPGTANLMENAQVCDLIIEYHQKGKLIGAICAAPTILGKLGILKGRGACCYPGSEEALLEALVNQQKVTVDGHIITSRGIGTAIDFALAIIAYLLDDNIAAEIAESIVYQQ